MVGERLRKSPALENMTIVLTTAYRLSPDEERLVMEQAGADKVIYKPLPKFHELKKMLEDLIAERRARLARGEATRGETTREG
jgi:CheY-like chemotaxis protein